jgi:hypothetical protein
MICPECSTAGKLNAAAAEQDSHKVRDLLLGHAQRYHALCQGGTWCDCQHAAGAGWLIPERAQQVVYR